MELSLFRGWKLVENLATFLWSFAPSPRGKLCLFKCLLNFVMYLFMLENKKLLLHTTSAVARANEVRGH